MESHSARLAWGGVQGTAQPQRAAGSGPTTLHPHPAGGSQPQGTVLVPMLSLCPTSILGYSQPFSHGEPLSVPRYWGRRGVRGHSATSTWMTAGTSLMLPGEHSGGTWAALGPWSQLPPLSSATPPRKGGGDSLLPWVGLLSPWPCAALTGLYSGSHSGMLRLLISEAIFFLCPGLVTPMAVRSWGREGGQCRPAAAVPPSHRPRPHLGRHPADGGDVVAGVDEVGCVELQLELAEPLVHGLRALGREGHTDRGSSGHGDPPLLPMSPRLSPPRVPPTVPHSPSPLMVAPFSSAGARRGAGGRRGSWPRSATATNLPEGQRSAGLELP